METDDPRASLVKKGAVSERAAAARDLARIGTWKDLELLVSVAWGEPKSTSVRLYSAAAAADIACRARGAFGQKTLSRDKRDRLATFAFADDPGKNPSMLMLTAAATPKKVLPRLARIVRDPRADVRLGVVTAIRRMVLSAVGDVKSVSAALGAWFIDPKVPADTRAELVKIVGEAGLENLRTQVLELSTGTPALATAQQLALDRLDSRLQQKTWSGLWTSDGLDIFELATEPRADDLAVLGAESFRGPAGERAFELADDGATIDGQRARLVWAIPLGTTEHRKALLVGGRVWWAAEDKALADLLSTRWTAFVGLDGGAVKALRTAVDELEGQAALRAGVVVDWLEGDHESALGRLESPMSKKRPRIDLFWWRGRVLVSAGRASEAIGDLETFLERATADAPARPAAEALLAEIIAG